MKFSDLKSLIQQGKLTEFQQQLEKSELVAPDYNLLLRQLIKNKAKKISSIFQKLIKKGADVNFAQIGANKKNNLMVACQQGNAQSVQLLCSHPKIDYDCEDSMKKTAPFYAIENKNKNDAEMFLDKVLKNAPHLINKPANNQTMLILAIKKQKPELVRILLNHQAEPNYIISDSGNTPLHEALKLCKNKQTRANKQIVKLLIEFGADPLIKNKKNKNAFQFADKFPLETLISEVQVRPRQQKQKIQTPKHDNVQPTKNKSPLQELSGKHKQSLPAKQKSSPAGEKTKSGEKKLTKQPKSQVQNQKKLLRVNSQKQVNDLIRHANMIFDKEFDRLRLKKDQKTSKDDFFSQDETDNDEISESSSEEDDTQNFAPFIRREEFIQELTRQVQNFQEKCDQTFHNAQNQFESFYHKLCEIAYKQKLDVQLCGSFSTGLWIKNCDIDILLVPHDQFIAQKNPNFIQFILDKFQTLLKKQESIKINSCIKNKKIRVPMLRLDIQFSHANGKSRKVDITVFDRNHNGLAIAHYISENIKVFPQLKPLFFTIKSLTYHFKLNDPKNGGIRTYAIIIMILSFLQNQRIKGIKIQELELGDLLLRFLYFFGFEYQYGYAAGGQMMQESLNVKLEPMMVLTIYDPLNHSNNLGKNTKAFELQTMFKAAYIALHTNIKQQKLQFMFGVRRICML